MTRWAGLLGMVVGLIFFSTVSWAGWIQSGPVCKVVNGYPDNKCTPGETLDVTAAEVCVAGYAGKTRHVTSSTKLLVYRNYELVSHNPGEYEIDHLISLQLGGSNAPENLWPESYLGSYNAHDKDRLENYLHKLVCSGVLSLKDAQGMIRTDWKFAYDKYRNSMGGNTGKVVENVE